MYVYIVICENSKYVKGVFTLEKKARELKEHLKNKYPDLNLKIERIVLDKFSLGEK